MGELLMWPMMFGTYERQEESAHMLWAESTQRIIYQVGLNESWIGLDQGLARMRLQHTGWTELNSGKVNK